MNFLIADNPNIIFDMIDGEMVMINLDNGCYYTMNESGSAVWGALQQTSSVKDVSAVFSSAFGPEALQAFLRQLLEQGLVRMAAEGRASDTRPALPESKSLAAPSLTVFADMKDLLLLDPVHEISEQGWPYTKPAA